MKRIIAILLFILILMTLFSCDRKEEFSEVWETKGEEASVETGKTHTDFEGMELEILNVLLNDEEAKLEVKWINETSYDVVYGENFDIRREDAGEWKSCVAIGDLAFPAIGYELKAGKTRTETYNLSSFDISQKETYRFVTDCFVYDKGRGGESTKCELWAEFTVTRTKATTVRESEGFSGIAITIPQDWNYERECGENSGEYSIAFWPKGEPEGKIKMCYYTAFGVCGTGLETERIKIGKYSCTKGTYDNKSCFDYIVFEGLPGSYVVLNEGAEKWWKQYGEKAMQILSTVKLAEGVLMEEEAIKIAKKEALAEYDRTRTKFDAEKGTWEITFYKGNTPGKGQAFTVTNEGKILKEEKGE